MSPFQLLLRSRKFLLAVLDAAMATVSILLTWFFAPEKVEQVMLLIGIWQPVIVAVIIGIALEDAAEKRAEVTHIFEGEPDEITEERLNSVVG